MLKAVENTCLFEYTETNGLGMIHILVAMDIHNSFLKKKRGKNIVLKGIDFVKSYCKLKEKEILKKLEDIPYFELDL